jgi:anti-sigma factor RsiW
MTDGKHISQDDLSLYAMQALSAEESAAVRAHLPECPSCREELAAIQGDLALVAMGVEQHPLPAGARNRFIDRIRSSASSTTSAPSAASAIPAVIPITQARKSPRYAAWIGWAAAAALLLVSADLAVRVRQLSQQLDNATAAARASEADNIKAREVLEVLTAPTAQRVVLTTGKTPPAPAARATYLPARGALVLQASNMQPLPDGKAYELWVIPANGTAPIPAGVFRPDANGSGSVVLPAIPQGVQAKAFGITIEKAEGSNTPTAPIVLSAAAPAAGE